MWKSLMQTTYGIRNAAAIAIKGSAIYAYGVKLADIRYVNNIMQVKLSGDEVWFDAQ